MSDEPTGWVPRADFICLNKKCEVDGAARQYELPKDAQFCPQGHKRLKRVFTTAHVVGTIRRAPEPDWRLTRTDASRTDKIMQRSYDQFLETKVQDPNMRALRAGDREMEVTLPGGKKFIQPSREQVAQMMGLGGKAIHAMDPNPENANRARTLFNRTARQDRASVPHILNRHDHRRALERSTGEMYGFKGVKD